MSRSGQVALPALYDRFLNTFRKSDSMWVVMLKSPDGDVFYGEAIDREGFRYRCKTPEEAEHFETNAEAEASFYYFRLMRPLQGYQLEAVDLQTISDL